MARKTGSLNHTHKYFKMGDLWFCGSRGCTHFMPKNMPPPVYKLSICWVCGEAMELDPDNMAFDHPTHKWCGLYEHTSELTAEQQEMLADEIERKEQAARMKKLIGDVHMPVDQSVLREGIKVEIAHTDGCASHSGQPCNCGAQ